MLFCMRCVSQARHNGRAAPSRVVGYSGELHHQSRATSERGWHQVHSIRFVGPDVHKTCIAMAVARMGWVEPQGFGAVALTVWTRLWERNSARPYEKPIQGDLDEADS